MINCFEGKFGADQVFLLVYFVTPKISDVITPLSAPSNNQLGSIQTWLGNCNNSADICKITKLTIMSISRRRLFYCARVSHM